MADTQRTIAALTALLADNGAGDISEQDLRDLFVTVVPNFGGVCTTGPGANTTIGTPGTFVKSNWNATGVQSSTPRNFTIDNTGRLTYVGTPTRHQHVACTISFSVAVAAAKEIEFRLAKNGTVIAGSRVIVNTNGATSKLSTALHWDVMLATNEYLELWVTNNTDTTAVALASAYLFAMDMPT